MLQIGDYYAVLELGSEAGVEAAYWEYAIRGLAQAKLLTTHYALTEPPDGITVRGRRYSCIALLPSHRISAISLEES
ncbi:hypothetical protein Pogu_1866 [Pyrobaculum oguniense TE7]|uniref:Uncharacterized protein n=1 Tax=Pyrobaculum oguniense (strain DSM 13380 / JCM 10595 / TE7) TaxID=698757 RepID=H6QAX0_PYROT|nr:hypothetical protein Pogu_1866 [Pyrobaculum oguniense TE7]